MSSSNLIRLGGLAALLGGVLLAIRAALRALNVGITTSDYPSSELATTWTYTLVNGMSLLGLVLLLVGLVGLYAAQSEAAGVLGLVGFLALFVGLAFSLSREWFEVFVLPDAAVAAPEWVDAGNTGWIFFGFLLQPLFYSVGWPLFALATLRTGVYSRAAAVALAIGAAGSFFPPLPGLLGGAIVRDAAIAWLGFALLTGRVGSREEPVPTLNLVRWGRWRPCSPA